MIGKLIYLIIYIKPDISFALRKLSQFISNPAEYYKQGVKALLRYIRFTANLEIIYGIGDAQFIGYSDADYITNKTNRKSTLR